MLETTYEVWGGWPERVILSATERGHVENMAALADLDDPKALVTCRVYAIPHQAGFEAATCLPLGLYLPLEHGPRLPEPVVETSEIPEAIEDVPTIWDAQTVEAATPMITQDMTQPITPEAKRRARKKDN